VASVENKLRTSTDSIVITDCRFANEVAAIKNAGGITIRVERGPNPEWYTHAINFNKGENSNYSWAVGRHHLEKLGIHASEYSSVGLEYDNIIANDGTIDDLHKKIESIINL
jgi:hypothetical protein